MTTADHRDELELSGALILIVDDTPENIQLLGDILAKEGFRLSVATGGQQALSIAAKKLPDIILLDIMMPDIDGFEVCELLKRNAETAHIPIMFLSAKTATEDKVRGFQLGGSDYITKPFEVAEVLARVRTHLKLKFAMESIHRYNHDLENMLEARTKDLIHSERQAAFGMLIQGIVHNMSGPLGAISICTESIEGSKQKMGDLSDIALETVQDDLRQLLDNVWESNAIVGKAHKKLVNMVQSMLTKSRSDKRSDLLIVDLNDVVRQELNFLDADLDFTHKVTREVKLSDSRLPLEAVPAEIAQLFQNLIRNALDALTSQPGAAITVHTGQQDRRVWLSVGDNGPGISEDILMNIFDPFFTTKAPSETGKTEGPVGTGLGLHYCRDTVKSYNGEITLDTTMGQGTTFTVYLPKASA